MKKKLKRKEVIKIWTLIKNENLEQYFNRYEYLAPYAEELSLSQNDEMTFFPRYMFETKPSRLLINHVDKSWKGQKVKLQWNMEYQLKPEQKTICHQTFETINNCRSNKVGIIKGRPGIGKTVMAVALTVATKHKTLIILDNSNLIKQWTESIVKFTNVKEEEIGLIKGPKFTTTKDTQFTIAMVQTLMSKVKRDIKGFYGKMKKCGFDLVFFDECHKTTCGPKFAMASLFLNTKNIVGLSATPFADKLHKIFMENTIGNIIVEDANYDLVPTINLVNYNSGLTAKYGKFVLAARDMIKQRARFISKLPESPSYKQLIIDLVKGLRKDGHVIIIIVFTKALVNLIHDWLKNEGIESRQFYSQKTDIDKDKDNIIIATYAFAGAGFDMKRLSAAIIGTPLSGRKSLIQVIGRILRTYKGKRNPIVYDLNEVGFAGLFQREIPRKIKILKDEFDCQFNTIDM
jgi:superfamily II DNA or RNA helicase